MRPRKRKKQNARFASESPAILAGLFAIVSMNSKFTESLKRIQENGAIESRHPGISGAMFILENFSRRPRDRPFDLHELSSLSWAQRTIWSERIDMEDLQDYSGLSAHEAEYLAALAEVTSAISRLQFNALDEPGPEGPTLRDLFTTPKNRG